LANWPAARSHTLADLSRLPSAQQATPQEVPALLEREQLFSQGCGYVDIALDRRLAALAQRAGALCHVTSRGDRREAIFVDDTDRARLLAAVAQGMARFDAKVLAYCLMSNHDHCALHTRRGDLSALMRHLNGLYAQASTGGMARWATCFRAVPRPSWWSVRRSRCELSAEAGRGHGGGPPCSAATLCRARVDGGACQPVDCAGGAGAARAEPWLKAYGSQTAARRRAIRPTAPRPASSRA
jgi:REP element-mobilizing transposase RayT